MAKKTYKVGGIKRITMIPAETAPTGAKQAVFGEFDSSKSGFKGIDLKLIAMDSVSMNTEDDTTVDKRYEDVSGVADSWVTEEGKATLVLTIEDMGAKDYLLGVAEVTEAGALQGWNAESPGFKLPDQALEIETLPLSAEVTPMLYRYTPLQVSVKPTGTLSKNGNEQIQITVTRKANMNADGLQIPSKYEKPVEEEDESGI